MAKGQTARGRWSAGAITLDIADVPRRRKRADQVPIELVGFERVDQLIPDPKNARKHGARNTAAIAQSMRDVGAARSIVIDEIGVIMAGNATAEGAAAAGITKLRIVDVEGDELVAVRRRGLTKAQKARLALADNRSAELADGWDAAILRELKADGVELEGLWSEREMLALLGETAATGLAGVDDLPDERRTSIKRGDLFALGRHRVLCGDSTKPADVAQLLEDERADLFWTDPPYAIFGSSTGVSGEVADDKMIRPFFRDILDVARTRTKQFGHIYICCDYRSWAAWWDSAKDAKVSVKNCIVWDKGNPAMGAMYRPQHEFLMFAANAYVKVANARGQDTGQRVIGNDSNLWDISREASSKKTHNAQKPVELVARALRNSTDADALVLDIFGGSGTTVIACEQLKRRARVLEIEPKFVQMIIDRWEGLTGSKARQLKGRRG